MSIYIVYHLLSERGIAKMGFAEDFIKLLTAENLGALAPRMKAAFLNQYLA